MKKIEAMIRSEKLDEVKDAILKAGAIGMTISGERIFARERSLIEHYRGNEYSVEFLGRIRVEIIVDDAQIDMLVQQLSTAARTGELGDGKIFISPIEQIVRIRTSETNLEAL